MSERGEVPVSEVLGEREGRVKVEESWSKHLTSADVGPVREFNREAAILDAVARRKDGTWLKTEETVNAIRSGAKNGLQLPTTQFPLNLQYFFVCKGRKMEYIGSREVDLGKFQRDISGRFFREWVKKQFDGRKDCDDIVSFGGDAKLKEIVDLMEMV